MAQPTETGNTYHISLWNALEQTRLEHNYRPDRQRQRTIFERIDWTTFNADIEDSKKGSGVGGEKMLRGKLFEMLIQADPEFGQRSALEKELLELAHNPAKFGLEKALGYQRNPDLAFLLVVDDEGIVIEGVGESKLGLLNERSYKQLSEEGFARGVKMLVTVVNDLEDPEQYGLMEIAKAKRAIPPGKSLLTMAPEFTQLLVVPANRKVEWISTLLNRKEFTSEGRKNFYSLFEKNVRVARAAFSTAEVQEMSQVLRAR